MDYFQRMAMIEENEMQNAELKRDIEARERRRLAGEEPAEWRVPESKLVKSQRLVFKTYDPQPMQQQSTVMDAEQQKQWDTWCDGRIEKKMRDVFIDAIAEFVSKYVTKRIEAEVAKLNEQIGSLRADNEILRSIVAGKTINIVRKDDRNVA